jgi:hypothetical protein
MNNILKLKSWQTFGLIIIMPVLFIIIGVILLQITGIKAFGFIFPLLATLTMMLSYYGWIWSAGIAIHKQSIPDRKRNLNTFKLAFVLALFFFLIVTPILKKVLSENSQFLIQLIRLASLFSFFYCIYFTAKGIQNIEKQKNIKSNSIFLDFILIWILPIGIWIIQPRINRILTFKEEDAQ